MDLNLELAIKRLKSGDSEAFNQIYELSYRKIYFLVLPILKDKALAEDIMQDTYLKFLEKLYDYKSTNSLAYILTIARNLAINMYNKRKREYKVEDTDIDTFSYEEFIEYKVSNQEEIKEAMSVLNETEKNIFLLHNVEDLPHREIAVILDKPLGTVTWTYQQALRKMRKKLKG
ncbi:MAG: RNA polymerase sigma factor [Tenericutes bacterium]|nr:RNA polymerase sigma factor [Mycoplasmatota bacterium]